MSASNDIRIEPVAAPRAAGPVQHAAHARPQLPPDEPKAAAEDVDVAASTMGHLQNAYAQFVIDPDTDEVVVRIRDASTDRILTELPSPEVQAMGRHMKEYADMLARRAAMQQAQGAR
jgi:hypothetical protein